MATKVLFIIDSLSGGGAERIMSYLVNGLDRERFSPHLHLLMRPDVGYELKPDVAVTSAIQSNKCENAKKSSPNTVFYLYGLVRDIFKSAFSLRSLIKTEKPEVVVVFLRVSIFMVLFSALIFKLKIPICCSDRILLSQEISRLRLGFLYTRFLQLMYRRVDAYVAVSEQARSDIYTFGVRKEKSHTIYNGLDIDCVISKAMEPISLKEKQLLAPVFTVVTVGRLEEQKGYRYLIRAFGKARKLIPMRLLIIGEGSEENDLRLLADQTGFSQDIIFTGWLQNPFKFISHAHLFVLSSVYEGFPNVLLEAMALGLPIVSTDCPSGPSEILAAGEYGLLVPPADENSLAEAIVTIARDEGKRNFFRQQSNKRINDFTLSRMLTSYEELISGLVPNAGGLNQ